MRVLDFLRPPLVAIDVGTAMTRVSFGAGRVVEQPSIVSERVDGAVITRPAMRSGVVTDIEGVASIIHLLLGRKLRRPAAVVCAPTDVSRDERDALIEAVSAGGASVVTVVPEPLGAAIGSGVDVASEYAMAIVDIGEGVTDFAVLRNASIVWSDAKRIGCSTFRDAIRDWNELRYEQELTDAAIEQIVRSYCNGTTVDEDVEMLLEPVVDDIASFIASAFMQLPDATVAEIIESGIIVTGGGAKLARLVARIEHRINMPLTASREPLGAVVRGAGAMLRNRKLLRSCAPDIA
jgi:rod shape-determining protein MreB